MHPFQKKKLILSSFIAVFGKLKFEEFNGRKLKQVLMEENSISTPMQIRDELKQYGWGKEKR